jgi:predicted nucleotidyltransferase component of viral defense system
LTYLLKVLSENPTIPLSNRLAFKGGTCLRKIYFGESMRFSEDLDFTATTITSKEVGDLVHAVLDKKTYYGLSFSLKDEYGGRVAESYGGLVQYESSEGSGEVDLNISFRERPSLEVTSHELMPASYFSRAGITPFSVPSLAYEEAIAEKVRAAFIRFASRDLFDLYYIGRTPHNRSQVRALVVVKCWNVGVSFNPDSFFARL